MGTSKAEIARWFDEGRAQGASHMLVICDTFDWDDYPVYVTDADAARRRADSPGNMQKTMEVYNLAMDKEPQLDARRAFNF